AALLASLTVGSLAGAVLFVNNHRDAQADARGGRRTLAIMAGPSLNVWIYAVLMLIPFALLSPLAITLPGAHVWLAILAMPLALVRIYGFAREPPGRGFNRILVQTVQVQILFSLLLCLGVVL
ncbi:MAG: UbiA family prenyltransferase, partial [Bradyrhizobiaceae bacterium]|nr:UbiA family prenyltransferase [Bradyrhizobiaceae bacterium]